jgi:RNA polymerase sigma factor (TIGR02999 family)
MNEMNLTEILHIVEAGDENAKAKLFEAVYDELKQLAAVCMASEDAGHTLQPTALVHEVYLRLVAPTFQKNADKLSRWEGRGYFFAAAAEAMRRILIESARRKQRQKRGGEAVRQPIDPDELAEPELADELLALDEALTQLAAVEPKIAELVKLRYFGGMTIKEAAEVLGMSPRTADAHWAYARAWLLEFIESDPSPRR